MERDEEIQEYYSLSRKYLKASLGSLEDSLYEPAMANAIHALELAIKAALGTVMEETVKTHNVGGVFGRHFRGILGDESCRTVNMILTKYNLPRYPGQTMPDPDEVIEDVAFIKHFIEELISPMLEKKL